MPATGPIRPLRPLRCRSTKPLHISSIRPNMPANLFALKEFGNIYTRIMNPTQAVLEERVAALEGGVAALAVASGQAASLFAVQNICHAGRQFRLLNRHLWRHLEPFPEHHGQHGHRMPLRRPRGSGKLPRGDRRVDALLVRRDFAQSRSSRCSRSRKSPRLAARWASRSSWTTPPARSFAKPIEHGAAIVMHSTTKYIGGHGTSIGGIVVDGGNFDWEKHADRFPMLNTPDPSYHGAVWTQAVKPLGPIAYIIKARVTLLRDIGAAMSPFNAFMFIQGLETVALRMRQHCSNAIAVANYLAKHPKVSKVIFPGLMTGENKRRADAYLKGGYGAWLASSSRKAKRPAANSSTI